MGSPVHPGKGREGQGLSLFFFFTWQKKSYKTVFPFLGGASIGLWTQWGQKLSGSLVDLQGSWGSPPPRPQQAFLHLLPHRVPPCPGQAGPAAARALTTCWGSRKGGGSEGGGTHS